MITIKANNVHLQLSGVAQPVAEICWFVSKMCRLVNNGAEWGRMRNETNFQRGVFIVSTSTRLYLLI